MALLLDNFTGSAGALSGHTADTGQNWAGSDATAVLDGSGRLYCNTSNNSPLLYSNAVVPQANMTMDIAFTIGTLPSPATYDYTDILQIALWGRYNYRIELHSRDNTHSNTPRLYVSASTGGLYVGDIAAVASSAHTLRFNFVMGTKIDVILDSVTVATATAPTFNVGDQTLAGYFDRNQDAGAPNQSAMLFIDSITINGVTPVPFWNSYTNCFEVDS
jgi:hypothetical protein